MPGPSVTFYLPYSTTVIVQAFVNAAWQERFTITPPGGAPIVFSGSGFYDTPVGTTSFTTPASGPSPDGAPVTVAIDHSADGGATWQPSQVDYSSCEIMYYNLTVVASEDAGDDTWDDATVYFSWTQVPQAPASSRLSAAEADAGPQYQGRA